MANVSSFSGAMPVIPGGLVELGYSEVTSTITIDNSTAGTGKEVVSPLTVVCDGGPVLVEFFSPQVIPANTNGDDIYVSLFQDGSELIRAWSRTTSSGATNSWTRGPAYLSRRLSPTAGSHTFGVKAYVTNNARYGYVVGGTGTTSDGPMFLRVSKIVNQNDGLKPFWTPPVVTQLPSQANTGDEVMRYTTSGAYQPHYYTGATDGWKQVGTSKPPLCLVRRNAAQSIPDNTVTAISFDTEVADTDGMFAATSTDVTVKTAGVYTISGVYDTGGTAVTGSSRVYVYVNGTEVGGTYIIGSAHDRNAFTVMRSLAVNDVITMRVYQTGPASAKNTGDRTQMGVAWLGPSS